MLGKLWENQHCLLSILACGVCNRAGWCWYAPVLVRCTLQWSVCNIAVMIPKQVQKMSLRQGIRGMLNKAELCVCSQKQRAQSKTQLKLVQVIQCRPAVLSQSLHAMLCCVLLQAADREPNRELSPAESSSTDTCKPKRSVFGHELLLQRRSETSLVIDERCHRIGCCWKAYQSSRIQSCQESINPKGVSVPGDQQRCSRSSQVVGPKLVTTGLQPIADLRNILVCSR